MKIRVFFALQAILSFVLRVQAVFVEWDQMHSSYYDLSSWGEESKWHVLGGNLDRAVYFEFWTDPYFRATALNTDPNWVSVWVRQMSYGDIVNEESMLGQDKTYFYHSEKGKAGIQSDYDIYSDPVYLAMCAKTIVSDEYSSYVYGWVEIGWGEYGNDPVVLSSAWDADGGPMIVGGGSALTPEPSSALLLLVGGALLALRRRRGGRTVRHILQKKNPSGNG